MKPILHIVKNYNDTQAIEIISKQSGDNSYGVTTIFIQDAVSLPPIPNVKTCALIEDVKDKPVSTSINHEIELITFEEMLNLIFGVESITVW